jgi:multidrug efflux pump subunit AcrB
MNEMVPAIKKAVEIFKKDYPQVEFALSQDQTFLLDAGISNLKQDLLYGGILTVLLLFMFLGNWASPSLMSISIPLSLIITFIFFYLFNISFNIISLSGLALGVGMLIDNSIVVIDNITRKRSTGLSMEESSVEGTNEVIAPVISQVLTTVAVYAPLILLSGMAGALVTDQAIGLTISLGVSLLVAFILAPLLYKLFLKTPPEKLKDDTVFYKWVSGGYHRMIRHILRHKLLYFLITLLIMPAGFWLARKIPVSALPQIEKKESLVLIDWNDPIDAQENLRRTKQLVAVIQPQCINTETEAGIKQFLLQQENNTVQKADIYFSCKGESEKLATDRLIRQWMQQKYPGAALQVIDAPNAFTQLFNISKPYLEARFKPISSNAGNTDFRNIGSIIDKLPAQQFALGAGFVKERNITLIADYPKMAVYGISRQVIEEALQQQFGTFTVSEIKRFGDVKYIRLKTDRSTLDTKLAIAVPGQNNTQYPLNYFLSVTNDRQPKFITADKSGEYQSIIFDEVQGDMAALQEKISGLAVKEGYKADFTGQYYDNKKQLGQLKFIFLLVLALLYFILAIQYESLVQPIVVMLTIPLGITGGMFLLWITGGTLDVMAAIGFIVILGLIVDDPILKIETLNRLEKKYIAQGLKHDDQLLEKMIHEAGDICLKPLLMVSLTTSIALVPVLFVGGIGNDLQKPLSIVIIGGLTIGTFFTTWFIPLAYWYVTKWKNKSKKVSA